MIGKISVMLQSLANESPPFPPTELYNEGWLLRLVLDWFSTHEVQRHQFAFPENARWFSEALLPSAFLTRYRGDKLAESWTHADGAIGDFVIGKGGKADLQLLPAARHFVVFEAKIFSKLSSGVSHARYFDQAARNVACISEVLRRSGKRPDSFNTLGFYVIAPASQIEDGVFRKDMNQSSIITKVDRRVREYGGEKDLWFREWFQPTVGLIKVLCLSWEGVIGKIKEADKCSGNELEKFYGNCLRFN